MSADQQIKLAFGLLVVLLTLIFILAVSTWMT